MYRIIHRLLTQEAVDGLVSIARKGKFVDGRVSAPTVPEGTKNNEQLAYSADDVAQISSVVASALKTNDELLSFALPQRFANPPMINRYVAGMYYKRHLDQPVIGVAPKVRTDFSMTIFLTPPESYQGGELVLELAGGDVRVKLEAGSAIVYDTGAYHWIAEVTSGERLAAVTWIQSFISDPRQRQIMRDVTAAFQRVRSLSLDDEVKNLLHRSINDLHRMWSNAV